jgi:hypothetical protein
LNLPRLIPLSQVNQYLGPAGRTRNGTGFEEPDYEDECPGSSSDDLLDKIPDPPKTSREGLSVRAQRDLAIEGHRDEPRCRTFWMRNRNLS